MPKIHFVYMWHDTQRNMFYVGKHSGNLTDNYISSNRWLNGEVRYRPQDFKRRIIKICENELEAQRTEGKLISMIGENEWGVKYYNTKQGSPKGVIPWNKGKKGLYSEEYCNKIAQARKGKPTTKGRLNPLAAENGKKGAKKQSKTVIGRKKVVRAGKTTWAYPSDPDYPLT